MEESLVVTKKALASDRDNIRSFFNCDICNKTYKTKKSLQKHVEGHKKNEDRKKCEICGQIFKQMKNLEKHKSEHPDHYPVRCKTCFKRFSTDHELESHLTVHNKVKIKTIKCRICINKNFTNEEDYLYHVKDEHEGKVADYYICSECGKQLRRRGELIHHIKSKCGTVKLYKCKVCNLELMSAGSLYNHMLKHKGERSYMCRFCAKQFLTAGQLKVHERSHTQEKAFVCDVCGKGFCHRQSLITHSTLHTGIKPFQCENCGNAFSCVGNLLKHRKTHADTCGMIPLTTHRVVHPPTRMKVKVNTPESIKFKIPKKEKEIQEKLQALKEREKQNLELNVTNVKEIQEIGTILEDNANTNVTELGKPEMLFLNNLHGNKNILQQLPLLLEENSKGTSMDIIKQNYSLNIANKNCEKFDNAPNPNISKTSENNTNKELENFINEFAGSPSGELSKSCNQQIQQLCASDGTKVLNYDWQSIHESKSTTRNKLNNIVEGDDDTPRFLAYGDLILSDNKYIANSSADDERKLDENEIKKEEIQIADSLNDADNSDDNEFSGNEIPQERDDLSEDEIEKTIETKDENNDFQDISSASKKRSKRKKKVDSITKEDIEKFIKERNFKDDKSSLICQYCKKSYNLPKCLLRHERWHEQILLKLKTENIDANNAYFCSCCKLPFNNKEECKAHQTAAHADILTCKDCHKIFSNLDCLRSHNKQFHNGEQKKVYLYVCDKCGMQFKQKEILQYHTENNCSPGPFFECKVCGKSFSTKYVRRIHMTVHEPVKRLSCKFCSKTFHWKGQLKIHERSHTGEKPFTCLYCPKAFAYRESLITHSSLHTGIRPHFCKACGIRFSCLSNLNKHKHTHASTCGVWYSKEQECLSKVGTAK